MIMMVEETGVDLKTNKKVLKQNYFTVFIISLNIIFTYFL